jgi:hypothetical protein
MSDKNILKEATIRKMMKLANIPALSEKFIQENYYDYSTVSEQEDEIEMEDEVVLDAPVDDIGIDAEVEEPAMEVDVAEELVKDLMDVIGDHFPEVEINVEAGDEEEVEADVELEEPMPEEPLPEEPLEGGEEELEIGAEVEEEEPVMERDLEEAFADVGDTGEETSSAAIEDEDKVQSDKAFMEEEIVEEEDDAHNALIDAIAAKVAERLLAEAKKTSK